jgi:hypothetical protein
MIYMNNFYSSCGLIIFGVLLLWFTIANPADENDTYVYNFRGIIMVIVMIIGGIFLSCKSCN